MKKLVYLFIVLSLLLALMPVAALAHTEEDPFVVELIAGQTMDVGQVKVWNDDDTLYVKYETAGWCLTETHLHLATSLDGIPQTKKGNPIPGQFDYSTEHSPCVTEYTYEIPLAWDPDTELFIAAHAAAGEMETMWVYSDGTETFSAVGGPGTAATAAAGIVCNAGPRTGTAVAAWQHSAWSAATSQFTQGTWVWEAYRSVNPICGDVVDFHKTFSIGYPASGWLKITTDNGYEVYLNDNKVGSDGVFGEWRTSDLTEAYVTTKDTPVGWKSVETYNNLIDYLQPGANTFWFAAGNEYYYPGDYNNGSPGTVDNNPGGLIYEAEISYYERMETAWGAGSEFPGKNWATYFTYTVQSPGPTVTPGAPTWTKAAGVRYRGYNTGKEIFLGPMLPPSALPRAEAEYNEFLTVAQKTYQINFAFDQGQNAISTSISSPDANLTFDFDVSGAPGCPSANWDAMEILVRDSRTDSGAALQNVMLDSFDLGDFGTVDKTGTPGWQNWTVTGFDFSQSFTVNADLVVDGYDGSESIKVEFNVGCLTP